MANSIDNFSKDLDVIEQYMGQLGSGTVSISKEYWNEGIALITMNNTAKRNAISGKMMVDFRKCIAELEQWSEGKAVILQGSGDNFCSGGDLDFAAKYNTYKDACYFSLLMNDILMRLKKLPLISIALLHGPTLGGGTEIAVSCDFILVCDNVKFGFVHGRMGIITAWGGTVKLVRKLGERKALELLLSSRILNAKECVDAGLASTIINTSDKLNQCLEWTRVHTQHHYSVVRAFKQAVMLNADQLEELVNKERELFVPLWGAQPNRDAVSKRTNHLANKF